MFKDIAFQFEDEVLFMLCLLSFSLNMVLQVKDRNIEVKLFNWVVNFASVILWGVIAYYMALRWLNMGFRMGFTIIVTLVAPDITMLFLSTEFRSQIVKALGQNIITLFKSFSKNDENIHDDE